MHCHLTVCLVEHLLEALRDESNKSYLNSLKKEHTIVVVNSWYWIQDMSEVRDSVWNITHWEFFPLYACILPLYQVQQSYVYFAPLAPAINMMAAVLHFFFVPAWAGTALIACVILSLAGHGEALLDGSQYLFSVPPFGCLFVLPFIHETVCETLSHSFLP